MFYVAWSINYLAILTATILTYQRQDMWALWLIAVVLILINSTWGVRSLRRAFRDAKNAKI